MKDPNKVLISNEVYSVEFDVQELAFGEDDKCQHLFVSLMLNENIDDIRKFLRNDTILNIQVNISAELLEYYESKGKIH